MGEIKFRYCYTIRPTSRPSIIKEITSLNPMLAEFSMFPSRQYFCETISKFEPATATSAKRALYHCVNHPSQCIWPLCISANLWCPTLLSGLSIHCSEAVVKKV